MMSLMAEEETGTVAVSETNTESKTVPSTVPTRTTEKPSVCNHCGTEVVPQEIKTPSGGKVYRCPKCGKFMKPQTPEQVEERKEEARGPLPP